MASYDEVKAKALEKCKKPNSEKCLDPSRCKNCFYYAPNYSKANITLIVKEKKRCSNCLHDREEEYCLAAHNRKTWLSDKCVDWQLDLTPTEFKKVEKWIESLDTLPMIRDELREKYPHGHPRFLDLILDEIRLHSDKNHDFAKGGNPLGNFNRVGAILRLYKGLDPGDPVVVAVSFMLKQLDASLWMLSQGYAAKVEGHAERWRDIAVYAKIISILIEERVPF